jgi:hypothetical protein
MVGRGSVVSRNRFAWVSVEQMVGVEARLRLCVDSWGGEGGVKSNDLTFLASALRFLILLGNI